MAHLKKFYKYSCYFLLIFLVIFIIKTYHDFSSPNQQFRSISSDADNLQILDRSAKPLVFSYQNRWNNHDNLPLHQIPELLVNAFITSEDRRFFEHSGVDFLARTNVLAKYAFEKKSLRGASTITEQVVRILHPRKRSLWSKWIEGLEAIVLESKFSKADILEFYLNQVPYSANRRGLVQAARYYFNRDLNTLNTKETLALVVLVRAPSKFDLYDNKIKIDESIARLASALKERGFVNSKANENLASYELQLNPETLEIPAFHFVDYVRQNSGPIESSEHKTITTLDGNLQAFVTDFLENRLKSLSAKNINNAAAIVIDNQTNEILAWVSVGLKCRESNNQEDGCMIDMVTSPRQPGSALKPFLYAAALDKGWNAATVIEDSPYSDAIGKGIKDFHNYSHTYYGKIRLRNALGNSLNIPALRTINYVTPESYLEILRKMEFESLQKDAAFYGDGLALGSGEVTLFELARAYNMLANRGKFSPLKITFYKDTINNEKQIYSPEITSVISNILSDPWSRSLEFGQSSVLNFPVQTAVKTGTSTDYRDAWAMGYNYRYTVGIWMGNVDYTPTDGITGSIGPSLALRSIFNELNKNTQTSPLFLSPKLIAKEICINPEDEEKNISDCQTYSEYFVSDDQPKKTISQNAPNKIEILRPTTDLQMAFDPRVPSEKQFFEMRLSGALDEDEVEWIIDNKDYYKTQGKKFLWQISRGNHQVVALVFRDKKLIAKTVPIKFQVK